MNEIAYARKAVQTPHVVLSTTLRKVSWPPNSQIVRHVAELRNLKGQPGTNAYVVGGATLVGSLLNEGLIDELRLIVHPVVLGKGRGLFESINERLSLDLSQVKSTESGRVIVCYRVISDPPVEKSDTYRQMAKTASEVQNLFKKYSNQSSDVW